MTKVSIIIPTINESQNLPLLLSDLYELNKESEIIVVDANSKDTTKEISLIYGVRYFCVEQRNRGYQLNYGANKAKGTWLFFLHADSRLTKNWSREVNSVFKSNRDLIYFFRFKVQKQHLIFRFLELFVQLRSNFLKTPYGDQGLLISRENFSKNKGYKNFPIMEDIDFILRLGKNKKLIPLKSSIFTSGRKWDNINILLQSVRNWNFRRRWLKGESPEKIYREYYGNKS